MLRFLIAAPLLMHGLANLAGLFAPWSQSLLGFSERPWVFSEGVTLRSGVGRAYSLLWLASSLLLAGAGLAVLFHWEAWRELAVAGSAASLASIAPWWRAVPPGARFGAVFDVCALAVLLSPWGEAIALAVR